MTHSMVICCACHGQRAHTQVTVIESTFLLINSECFESRKFQIEIISHLLLICMQGCLGCLRMQRIHSLDIHSRWHSLTFEFGYFSFVQTCLALTKQFPILKNGPSFHCKSFRVAAIASIPPLPPICKSRQCDHNRVDETWIADKMSITKLRHLWLWLGCRVHHRRCRRCNLSRIVLTAGNGMNKRTPFKMKTLPTIIIRQVLRLVDVLLSMFCCTRHQSFSTWAPTITIFLMKNKLFV